MYPSYFTLPDDEEDDKENESPYPEVQASVSSIDDPTMPVNTFRVYVLVSFRLELILNFSQLVFGHVFRSFDIWSE